MAGTAGSNPTVDMVIHLLRLWCVVYVTVSATNSSLTRWSPTGCVCVYTMYGLEFSTKRPPRPK
jgi:hypothetical protein